MKETFYFSHDYNAQSDDKILNLRMDLWWEGYGIYWALVERLASHQGELKFSSIKSIAYDMQCDNSVITDVITKYNLFIFDEEKDIFYNKRIREHHMNIQEYREIKSLAGKKWMAKRWKQSQSITDNYSVITEPNCVITDHNKINKNKINKNKINKKNISKEISKKAITPKGVTLQELIKENFDKDFMGHIYNKYNMTKESFCEESELFVLHRTQWVEEWKKPLWQKEKAFDVRLRFRTWMKNHHNWSKTKSTSPPVASLQEF